VTEGTREIAERLTALSDDDLARLLAARGVSPAVGWQDFFDAAEALTAEPALTRALAALPAADLRALADSAPLPLDAPAVQLLLTDAAGRTLPAVARALAPFALGDAADTGGRDDGPAADTVPPADAAAQAHAAERAFTSLDMLGDLLLMSLHTPLAILGSGALSAADRRRLTEETPRPDALDALVELAVAAGLLAREERMLLPTPAGESWLREPTPVRWSRVAQGLLAELPPALVAQRAGGGWMPPARWADAYPADPDWPARAAELHARALTWGVLTEEDTEPGWSRALRAGDTETVAAELSAALPHEVDRIYLQNDLTAISPGPLASALDVRLRGIARRESHAQASTYRFTAETIAAALAEGQTQESILALLAELSLTGVPQPLEYLVRTSAQRHGSIRVGSDDDGRTTITADATILDTLAVDQSLRPLGLVRSTADTLSSRVSRDAVLWSLVDARYPAIAVSPNGTIEPLRRHRLAAPAPADAAAAYTDLIDRLRAADADDADAAWLERRLDASVRSRAVIEVDVELPGGELRTFVLEVSGLGGGRLRGRERGTEVERTLPVSSIRAVRDI